MICFVFFQALLVSFDLGLFSLILGLFYLVSIQYPEEPDYEIGLRLLIIIVPSLDFKCKNALA